MQESSSHDSASVMGKRFCFVSGGGGTLAG